MPQSYRIRITALAERARRARNSFLPPVDPPDENRAVEYLRDGVGPTVALFEELSADDRCSPEECRQLDRIFVEWLELYTACYEGYLDPRPTLRDAAALIDDGYTLRETARRLTGVPSVDEQGAVDRSGSRVGTVRSDRQ